MPNAPKNHDEYLANVRDDQRGALQDLRQMIRAIAPLAEECISYQIAAFRQGGMLVGYGATDKHCALFLMSNRTVAAHAEQLKAYDTSTGTVRFQPDKPLPETLVRKLVEARLAEKAAGTGYGGRRGKKGVTGSASTGKKATPKKPDSVGKKRGTGGATKNTPAAEKVSKGAVSQKKAASSARAGKKAVAKQKKRA